MGRRRWVLGSLVLVCAVSVAAPTAAAPTGRDALRADLDEILADQRLAASQAGVRVTEADTGDVLYSKQARARATPASNMKLFTSAAAMDVLGPDHRFHTSVATDAARQGDALLGDLYLRGTGDPTMRAEDYDKLASEIANSGIREVQGRLVTDDSWFDDVPLGSGWAWDDEPYYYAAPVSALTVAPNTDYDAGTVIVRATPGEQGQPAKVQLQPETDAVRIDNRTTTSGPGTEPDLLVERDHGSDRVVLTGSLPVDSEPVEEFSSVAEPSSYAGDVFRRALAAHGVRIGETTPGTAPAGARELAGRDSMPLHELLVPFMKLSNNGHAEALIKAMGKKVRDEGSWQAGTGVLDEALNGLGVDPDVLNYVDGSGLSTMDAVTPEQTTKLLRNVRERPWFEAWNNSLPVAGMPDRFVGGTLTDRMVGTPAENNVHAKTGTLTGATALSGYVTAANGRELIFSVMFNDYVSDSPTDLEDAIAVRLAQYRGERAESIGVPAVPKVQRVPDDPRTNVDESDLECSWVKAC